MREKQLKCIVTFPSTTAAMAAEQFCLHKQLPGRLIPVPREITASCGMAWCAPVESKALLQRAFAQEKLAFAGFYTLMI